MLWPTARSYSGQPSAELHTFGSLPVLRSIVDAAIKSGARAARPGEFTMRAFLAGRLDLTQAEAVLGVIEAEGRGSLDHALRQLAGNLARPLNEMRSTILDLLADVEAGLDFVDEDIEFISDEVLIERLATIDRQLGETATAIQSRGGGAAMTKVVLRGEPNAGKSSLLNRLAGNDVAIVADLAGTTRDTVTAEVNIRGHQVLLVDTAGIEESTSSITAQSQQQGNRAAGEASIHVWCFDGSGDLTDVFDACPDTSTSVIDIKVVTKSDLSGKTQPLRTGELDSITCSAATGEGIEGLQRKIVESIEARDAEEVGTVIGTAARCGQSIDSAREAIAAAIRVTRNQDGHEFVSAELRIGANHLGEVTGAVYTDDILDRVFGRFCIGK
jgi:tRNA modification GTPase